MDGFLYALIVLALGVALFSLASNSDTNDANIVWDVCNGHGKVERIRNQANNSVSDIRCSDGSLYRLTLTVR